MACAPHEPRARPDSLKTALQCVSSPTPRASVDTLRMRCVAVTALLIDVREVSPMAEPSSCPRQDSIAASASSIAWPTAERRSSPSGSTTIRLCVPRVCEMSGQRAWMSVPKVKQR